MTRIEFHTGVAAPLSFACRLLRKATRQGVRAAVVAPPATLQALDRDLWTFDEREFVPHLRVHAANAGTDLARRTPIWLVDLPLPAGTPAVLVNVGAELASLPEACTRLIEIVSTQEPEVSQARVRWRRYAEMGWPVEHHRSAAQT